jgi:hypothetical protein
VGFLGGVFYCQPCLVVEQPLCLVVKHAVGLADVFETTLVKLAQVFRRGEVTIRVMD